ncbi:LuxR C-terminal-related transcriptional regulator [Kutzneria chonburiensis]|uniref:LuxR C-terminal-related transcriptional regulator n=1 Tax=Kutzneria chonburiensis TaxID=1483604 RepID=A0ABV6N400_9PSEU|nr:response regulator transcription factor [Kutzneria chonburiensis]
MDRTSEAAIEVVLLDHIAMFREAVRNLFEVEPDIRVVAEGANGADALAIATEFMPDIVMLDIEMTDPYGGGLLAELRARCPGTRTVVLTMCEDPAMVQEALEAGIAAYLVKSSIVGHELVAAIRSVTRGPDNVLLSVPRQTMAGLRLAGAVAGMLSERERSVLELAAQALSNTQIANRLYIAEGTVKRHLTNIYSKLGAVSRVDAIRKAMQGGLIRS